MRPVGTGISEKGCEKEVGHGTEAWWCPGWPHKAAKCSGGSSNLNPSDMEIQVRPLHALTHFLFSAVMGYWSCHLLQTLRVGQLLCPRHTALTGLDTTSVRKSSPWSSYHDPTTGLRVGQNWGWWWGWQCGDTAGGALSAWNAMHWPWGVQRAEWSKQDDQ